jgi:peptide/nickel transport system substrate-binding protein
MKRLSLLITLLLVALLLVACGASSEPEPAKEEPAATPTPAPTAEPTKPPEPAVGGTLVFALSNEPTTLDVHLSAEVYDIGQYIGASLLSKDLETGEYIPYLAEEWSVSEDGLSYEFKLREDVKFHDGSPLTAHDYAWTFNRALTLDGSTAGSVLLGLAEAVAVDDYTLQFNMAQPNSILLDVVSRPTYHQPLSQAYVEKMGDDYGRNPMGVGPYKFKEWKTGDKIVLERNPDFNWGPAFTRGDAPYIETIEFRVIPEYATQLAGAEADEIDYLQLEAKDVDKFKSDDRFQVFDRLDQGSGDMIFMNVTKSPFDDIKVRQAFNLAVNRDALVDVILRGHGIPSSGPITAGTVGYWPGVEDFAYGFDLDKAKELMAEAGYTPGDDGILQKDGQPLKLVLKTLPAESAKTAEILQQQFKALGVDVTIEQHELGILYSDLAAGKYEFAINRLGWQDYGLMFAMYHPAMLGVFNHTQLSSDEELNGMLMTMIGAPVQSVVQDAANQAQQRIVEQAYSVPLFTTINSWALNKRVQDATYTDMSGALYLFDAYIETSP